MRSAAEVKQDFDVIASHGDIIDVLKTANLIQFKVFQSREKPNEAFLKEAGYALADIRLALQEGNIQHPIFLDRKELPSAIVIISSDEGFLGEINTLLLNTGLDQRTSDADELIILGERGARYFEDLKLKFTYFPGLTHRIRAAEVDQVRDYLFNIYSRRIGRIIIVYPAFVSLMVQKVTLWKGLPFTHADEAPTGIRPGLFKDLLIEPSVVRVTEGLVKLWLGSKILQIFWSSKLAEYAARIMHLEGSSQEITQRRKSLFTEYFRQVHSNRDKIIREITASRQISGRKKGRHG